MTKYSRYNSDGEQAARILKGLETRITALEEEKTDENGIVQLFRAERNSITISEDVNPIVEEPASFTFNNSKFNRAEFQ